MNSLQTVKRLTVKILANSHAVDCLRPPTPFWKRLSVLHTFSFLSSLVFFFFFFLFWIHLLLLCPCNFCSTFFCRFSLHFPLHFAAFLFFLCLMTMIIINIHFFCKLFLGLFFFIARFSLFSIGFLYHLLIWCRVVCIAVCLSFSCTARIQRANEKKTRKKHERKKIKAEAEKSFSFFFFLLHSKFKISTS